jgi:hypothetical protein
LQVYVRIILRNGRCNAESEGEMITVNGKTLEVGDTAVFRCGGKAIIEKIEYELYNLGNRVYYKGNYYSTLYKNDGKECDSGDCVLDIIDIEKAPKPEIVEVTSEVSFSNCIFGKKTEHIIKMKYKESFEYLQKPIEFKLKYVVDVANKKILSVKIVED